ncbi:MAG: radical SAM protein [Nitrospirota bacterium]
MPDLRVSRPDELLYRIYGNALAVVMNVKENRVALLQNRNLVLWKEIAYEKQVSQKDYPGLKRLAELGLIKIEGEINGCHRSRENDQPVQEVDLGTVNYWAFKNHLPISGHFELTGRCNLRCRHCYCTYTDRDTLDTGSVIKIVDGLYESGTFGLVLTGGEIFMRSDIIDVLKYLNEKKFVLRLNTNGVLIDDKTVKAMDGLSNIYRIHVSLYSSKPEVHDRITGMEGSFQKTLKAICLLKEAGFALRINCSLMQSNSDSYKGIKTEIGDKLDIPVHYDPFIFPRDDGKIRNMYEMFNDDQIREFEMFHTKEPSDKKPKLCKAAFSFFSISEDGGLYPCLKMKKYYEKPLADLRKSSFKEIWYESEQIKKIRNILNDKLRNCNVCNLSI